MDEKTLMRFWSKVEKTLDGCWLWLKGKDTAGYGVFDYHSRSVSAHRFAYEVTKGKINDGLALDHLCRTPACVNPAHLDPVPNAVNILRGIGQCAQNARKTHCKRGHELSGKNVRHETSANGKPKRRCLVCLRLMVNAKYAERKKHIKKNAAERVVVDTRRTLLQG